MTMGYTFKKGDVLAIKTENPLLNGKRVRVVRASPVGNGYTVELLEDATESCPKGEQLHFAGYELAPPPAPE